MNKNVRMNISMKTALKKPEFLLFILCNKISAERHGNIFYHNIIIMFILPKLLNCNVYSHITYVKYLYYPNFHSKVIYSNKILLGFKMTVIAT
jgi:hypothetical protein